MKPEKKVSIKGQMFQAEQTPDTQEDNHNGIIGRWNLYEEEDESCTVSLGRLIQWTDQWYCTVLNNNRKTYYPYQVQFQ